MVVIENGEKLRIKYSTVEAVEDRLLCVPMKRHNITDNGILVLETKGAEFSPVIVKKKGSLVTIPINIGDLVLIRPNSGVFLGSSEEDVHVVIRQSEIITFVKRELLEKVELPTQDELKAIDELKRGGNLGEA